MDIRPPQQPHSSVPEANSNHASESTLSFVTARTASSYDGWLVSESFWKRAVAIWGHLIVVQIIFMLVLGFLFAFFGISLLKGLSNEIENNSGSDVREEERNKEDAVVSSTTPTTTDETQEFGTDVGGEGMSIE